MQERDNVPVPKNNGKPWSRGDKEWLRESYKRYTIPQLAEKLKRTEYAVECKLVTMELPIADCPHHVAYTKRPASPERKPGEPSLRDALAEEFRTPRTPPTGLSGRHTVATICGFSGECVDSTPGIEVYELLCYAHPQTKITFHRFKPEAGDEASPTHHDVQADVYMCKINDEPWLSDDLNEITGDRVPVRNTWNDLQRVVKRNLDKEKGDSRYAIDGFTWLCSDATPGAEEHMFRWDGHSGVKITLHPFVQEEGDTYKLPETEAGPDDPLFMAKINGHPWMAGRYPIRNTWRNLQEYLKRHLECEYKDKDKRQRATTTMSEKMQDIHNHVKEADMSEMTQPTTEQSKVKENTRTIKAAMKDLFKFPVWLIRDFSMPILRPVWGFTWRNIKPLLFAFVAYSIAFYFRPIVPAPHVLITGVRDASVATYAWVTNTASDTTDVIGNTSTEIAAALKDNLLTEMPNTIDITDIGAVKAQLAALELKAEMEAKAEAEAARVEAELAAIAKQQARDAQGAIAKFNAVWNDLEKAKEQKSGWYDVWMSTAHPDDQPAKRQYEKWSSRVRHLEAKQRQARRTAEHQENPKLISVVGASPSM